MNKELTYKQNSLLKARILRYKTQFIEKVINHSWAIDDAFNPRFRNYIRVFIPKFSNEFLRPCIFIHISNGNSSTLMRIEKPSILIRTLYEILTYIQSNQFLATFEHMEFLASKMITNEPIILDQNFFNKEITKTKK